MELDSLKQEVANLDGRVGKIERTLMGAIDETTNKPIPGLMQIAVDTAERTASIEKWVKFGALGIALAVLSVAFPRLYEVIKVVMAAAG